MLKSSRVLWRIKVLYYMATVFNVIAYCLTVILRKSFITIFNGLEKMLRNVTILWENFIPPNTYQS